MKATTHEGERGVVKIGVIADTHQFWHPRIVEIFSGVDEVWHLGDVGDARILENLRAISPRLSVVEGNNDYNLTLPSSLTLEREGARFYLIHIDLIHPPSEIDWVLHGHTHVPRQEQVGRVRYFNPGSAGKANRGAPLSVGLLIKRPGTSWVEQVIRL